MAEFDTGWLYEAGIGENRAVFLESGELSQTALERHSDAVKAGAVFDVTFKEQWVAGTSGIVVLASGEEALVQPLPKGQTEGAEIRVEIVREAMIERGGQVKRAKAKPAAEGAVLQHGANLLERLEASGEPVKQVYPHDDILGQSGWHEMLEQSETGLISFDGGNLLISLTPAMTVIDIDGTLPPVELAKRAAKEVARSLVRLDISGSIGVDFPTLQAKSDRTVVAAIFDEYMTGKCERTAINGFGFMQIISRRVRQSLPEILQSDSVLSATLDLLRQAERVQESGTMILTVHPAIAAKLKRRPALVEELSRRTGRAITIEAQGSIPINGGQISAA